MTNTNSIIDSFTFLRNNKTLGADIAANNLGTLDDHLKALLPVRGFQPRGLTDENLVHFGLALYIIELEKSKGNGAMVQAKVNEILRDKTGAEYASGTVYFTIVGCSRSTELIKGSILNDPICASTFLKVDYEQTKHSASTFVIKGDGLLSVKGLGTTTEAVVLKPKRETKLSAKQLSLLYDKYNLDYVTEYVYEDGGLNEVASYFISPSSRNQYTAVIVIICVVVICSILFLGLYIYYRGGDGKAQQQKMLKEDLREGITV